MFTRAAILSFFLFAVAGSSAEAPRLIPFQGRLLDRDNKAIGDGVRLVRFEIYGEPTGGRVVWAGEDHRTSVNGGLVNVILGVKNTFPLTQADQPGRSFFDQPLYLQITVGADMNSITSTDIPLMPRQTILPVVFAAESANSRKLAGYDWTEVFGPSGPSSGFINGQKLAPGSVTTTQLDPAVRAQLDPMKISLTALESIREHDAVGYARDSNSQAGLIQASASSTDRAAFFGFATGTAKSGQIVTAQQYGLMAGFSNLKAGYSYYLGTNAGEISHVYPYGLQQYVGHAMSETTLFIDPFGISKSWGWASLGNYWGNRFDGALTTSGNVSFPVAVDGDVVVKQFSGLTINAGDTVTTSERCRGLVIYVDGDAVINGTLSMTARGANVDPTLSNSIPDSGIRLVRRKAGGADLFARSDLGGAGLAGVGPAWIAAESAPTEILRDRKAYFIARSGGVGGTVISFTNWGPPGQPATNGSGGGGSGGAGVPPSGSGGAGGAGTCYSGGSGGGGGWNAQGSNGGPYGGAGGVGIGGPDSGAGDGAGNTPGRNGGLGTGGLLVLFVKGKLTIGRGARISCNGIQGEGTFIGGGGGSGGGRLIVLHGGDLFNQGVIEATGGPRNDSPTETGGGAGGHGAVTIDKIDP